MIFCFTVLVYIFLVYLGNIFGIYLGIVDHVGNIFARKDPPKKTFHKYFWSFGKYLGLAWNIFAGKDPPENILDFFEFWYIYWGCGTNAEYFCQKRFTKICLEDIYQFWNITRGFEPTTEYILGYFRIYLLKIINQKTFKFKRHYIREIKDPP